MYGGEGEGEGEDILRRNVESRGWYIGMYIGVDLIAYVPIYTEGSRHLRHNTARAELHGLDEMDTARHVRVCTYGREENEEEGRETIGGFAQSKEYASGDTLPS